MQKKTGIRALALVLALVMVMGLMPAAKAAPAESETQRFKTIAQYLDEQKITFDRVAPPNPGGIHRGASRGSSGRFPSRRYEAG